MMLEWFVLRLQVLPACKWMGLDVHAVAFLGILLRIGNASREGRRGGGGTGGGSFE